MINNTNINSEYIKVNAQHIYNILVDIDKYYYISEETIDEDDILRDDIMELIIPKPKKELNDNSSEEVKKQWKKYNKLNAYLVKKRYVDKLWKLVGLETPTYKSPYEKYSEPDTYLNKYMYSSEYHESDTAVLHEDNKLFTSLGYIFCF